MRDAVGWLMLVWVGCNEPVRGGGTVDGAVGDGRAVDAPIGGGSGAIDTITCQTHTRTVVNADGSKQVSDSKFAVVDVGPDEDFVVESCDYTITSNGVVTKVFVPVDGACPAGATCTTAGVPFPMPTTVCTWNRLGTFFDGRLYVFCGSETRTYNTSGTLTGTTSYSYGVIRVHH